MKLIYCTQCGAQISDQAQFCLHCGKANEKWLCKQCGTSMSPVDLNCKKCGHPAKEYILVPKTDDNSRNNGLGTAGFVLSMIGTALCWIPAIGGILLFLALNFSIIGLIVGLAKKKSIVLSIIGMAVSLVFLILAVTVIGAIAGSFADDIFRGMNW